MNNKLNKKTRLSLAKVLRRVEADYNPQNARYWAGICLAAQKNSTELLDVYGLINKALKEIQQGWAQGYLADTNKGFNEDRLIMCLLMAHWLEDSASVETDHERN